MLELISGVMFHNNCDNSSFDRFGQMLDHIEARFGHLLRKLQWVSLGAVSISPLKAIRWMSAARAARASAISFSATAVRRRRWGRSPAAFVLDAEQGGVLVALGNIDESAGAETNAVEYRAVVFQRDFVLGAAADEFVMSPPNVAVRWLAAR